MSLRAIAVLVGVLMPLLPAELGYARPTGSLPLDSLSPGQLSKCRRSSLLRPVCPPRVPRVAGDYRAVRAQDRSGFHVFDLERFGVPLRPPRGAHITVAAGAVWRLTPYTDPTRTSKVVQLSDEVRGAARPRPVSFGDRSWNGRVGILYLAPPFPNGGQLGDHLVFQWQGSGRTYAMTLHSWGPLRETEATLRAMVRALS